MTNNNSKTPKNEAVDGVKNWLIVMVCVFSAGLTMESYNRFGIVKGPIEIINSSINMTIQHWWLSFTTLICYFLQIALTFILEKFLATGLISEKMGMTLHAVNVLFLPTAFTILARRADANPIMCRLVSTCIVFVMVKVWFYAYVNSTFRKSLREKIITKSKKNEDEKCILQYPNNVTIRNILAYMVFTPPIQYQMRYPQRTKPDWRMFWKLCLQQLLVYCATGLLFCQFIFPEMFILRAQGGGLINIIECFLRIAMPLNLIWLIFAYVNTYKIYLPAYAALTGFKNETFSKDWWNAEDMNLFWRKWNWPVHTCLKYCVFVPLIQNGNSKTMTTLIAFAIAGIIHEYLNSLPLGIYTGAVFLLTITEMPAGCLSEYIAQKLGSHYGNKILWSYLVIAHYGAIVYYALTLPHFAANSPFKMYFKQDFN